MQQLVSQAWRLCINAHTLLARPKNCVLLPLGTPRLLRALRLLLSVATVGVLSTPVHAQPSLPPLSDFSGTYRAAPAMTLEIVAGDALFAVLDDAKYALKRVAADAFVNGSGDTVRFPRDARGRVTGYVERGAHHPRLSRSVTASSQALAFPRPRRSGKATEYRYRVPIDRHDGIPVGHISESDLDVAAAESIIRGILDGTHRDVHGVLLFQRGKLVLEEYFYGYDVQRPHQLRSATKSIVERTGRRCRRPRQIGGFFPHRRAATGLRGSVASGSAEGANHAQALPDDELGDLPVTTTIATHLATSRRCMNRRIG